MLDTCQYRNFYFKKTFPRVQGHTDWCTLTVDSYRAFFVVVVVIMTYERNHNTLQKIVLGFIQYVFNNGGEND